MPASGGHNLARYKGKVMRYRLDSTSALSSVNFLVERTRILGLIEAEVPAHSSAT
jgi:hypothetical protein